jgi:hypothetical protein
MTGEINSDPGHLAATLAGAIVNLFVISSSIARRTIRRAALDCEVRAGRRLDRAPHMAMTGQATLRSSRRKTRIRRDSSLPPLAT